MSILLLFLDGVGLGADDAAVNPVADGLPSLNRLIGGRLTRSNGSFTDPTTLLRPLDATLGVPGLPQSGTGQTAIYTGVNAAEVFGRHYGPYPPVACRPLLAEGSLFGRMMAAERRVVFANAFPSGYFAALESRRVKLTASGWMCSQVGLPLFGPDDLRAGRAISADFTGRRFPADPPIPPLTPADVAERLVEIVQAHDLTLVEHYATDFAGHGRYNLDPATVLAALDAVLSELLIRWDAGRDLLVITSDHGNLEDASVRGHTLNPVPLLAHGAGADRFATARSLLDVTPILLRTAEIT